ncbi:GNAT family N-acetyltransferase [Streptomyces tibetensis]|uniref:GNAT family N-acetyltransferase n=1 Tax=Streptomyces tibetensis TaxID=2382123 RepID=A0ABW6N8Y8_9ACTN
MTARHLDVVIREAMIGADDDAVTDLFKEYLTGACDRVSKHLSELGELDQVQSSLDELVASTDAEQIRANLAQFRPPDGQLFLAERNGRGLGIGALRTIGPTICEIKRLYVRQEARRQGIAVAISERLLQQARTLGMSTVRLDTFRDFGEAQALIQAGGFKIREPYTESEIPEPLRRFWIFFEREL